MTASIRLLISVTEYKKWIKCFCESVQKQRGLPRTKKKIERARARANAYTYVSITLLSTLSAAEAASAGRPVKFRVNTKINFSLLCKCWVQRVCLCVCAIFFAIFFCRSHRVSCTNTLRRKRSAQMRNYACIWSCSSYILCGVVCLSGLSLFEFAKIKKHERRSMECCCCAPAVDLFTLWATEKKTSEQNSAKCFSGTDDEIESGEQGSNVPHCVTCSSISVASIFINYKSEKDWILRALFSLFSSKEDLQKIFWV